MKGIKLIPLDERGSIAIINESDYKKVSAYKWHKSDTGYAVWRGMVNGVKRTVRMHRLITGAPEGLVVDHINHNPLDNRASNLRICTQTENMRNKKDQGNGYWYQKKNNNWVVEVNGKHRGVFNTEPEASEFVKLVRAGIADIKPKVDKTHCKQGHSLDDAYIYKNTKHCKTCQTISSKKYFKKSYIPKPKEFKRWCSRGHDRLETITKNGDCITCRKIRSINQRSRNNGGQTKR